MPDELFDEEVPAAHAAQDHDPEDVFEHDTDLEPPEIEEAAPAAQEEMAAVEPAAEEHHEPHPDIAKAAAFARSHFGFVGEDVEVLHKAASHVGIPGPVEQNIHNIIHAIFDILGHRPNALT